jgi:hypothetical protein
MTTTHETSNTKEFPQTDKNLQGNAEEMLYVLDED